MHQQPLLNWLESLVKLYTPHTANSINIHYAGYLVVQHMYLTVVDQVTVVNFGVHAAWPVAPTRRCDQHNTPVIVVSCRIPNLAHTTHINLSLYSVIAHAKSFNSLPVSTRAQ